MLLDMRLRYKIPIIIAAVIVILGIVLLSVAIVSQQQFIIENACKWKFSTQQSMYEQCLENPPPELIESWKMMVSTGK